MLTAGIDIYHKGNGCYYGLLVKDRGDILVVRYIRLGMNNTCIQKRIWTKRRNLELSSYD